MHESITPQEQKRSEPNKDVAAEWWIVISEHDAITPAKPHFSRRSGALGTKWWLLPVSRRPLLLFREALIYLS